MKQGQIRIIGGQWRGRKLKVLSTPHLRPTPDRVRETLFNWLSPVITGAYCIDLFAGSGALGFEALSRGAAYVVMVDQLLEVTQLLQEEAKKLKTNQVEIYRANVPEQLRAAGQSFNIVFLDPPFQSNLLLPTCFYLEQHAFLAENALIYLETSKSFQLNDLPQNWQIIKKQIAGQVAYYLAKKMT